MTSEHSDQGMQIRVREVSNGFELQFEGPRPVFAKSLDAFKAAISWQGREYWKAVHVWHVDADQREPLMEYLSEQARAGTVVTWGDKPAGATRPTQQPNRQTAKQQPRARRETSLRREGSGGQKWQGDALPPQPRLIPEGGQLRPSSEISDEDWLSF